MLSFNEKGTVKTSNAKLFSICKALQKNLEVHNFSKLQELCMNILIKFFKTVFNLLIRILKNG